MHRNSTNDGAEPPAAGLKRDLPHGVGDRGRAFLSTVPELTPGAHIKLNRQGSLRSVAERLSLRGQKRLPVFFGFIAQAVTRSCLGGAIAVSSKS